MTIESISHITFIVKDLQKTAHIFIKLFNAKEIYDSKEDIFSISKEKFFLINNLWIALMEGNPLKEKTYNHIAFKIKPEDFDRYVDQIQQLGLEIKEGRPRISAESKSVYFYDFDNHLFEFHTGTLEKRLTGYLEQL